MVLASLYYISVLMVAALALASTEGKLPKVQRFRYAIVFGYSLISEWPLVFILSKIGLIVIASTLGVFNGWIPRIFYVIDLLTMIGLFVIFIDGYEVKSAMETVIQAYSEDSELPSFKSETFWQRMVNPRFIPKDVIHYENITYSNLNEANEARKGGDFDQPAFMRLDVYARKDITKKSLKPVLLFVHGSGWVSGDKGVPYPLIRHLAEAGWVVVSANYRLAPAAPYPAQLVDIKRALRWIKENIQAFGGDSKFTVIAGDDSGGHLAAVTALTPNKPEFQPGFESVDTRVKATILINAYTDLIDKNGLCEPGLATYFAKNIAVLPSDYQNTESFLQQHSPLHLLKEDSVPFLVFHGDRDNLIPCGASRHFVNEYKKVSKSEIHYIEIPGGHHAYHLFSSPRSHYQAIGVERWLNHLYHQGKNE